MYLQECMASANTKSLHGLRTVTTPCPAHNQENKK